MVTGSIIGTSSMVAGGGSINISAYLSVSFLTSTMAIVNAYNVVNNSFLGAFVLANNSLGGVNITASSLSSPDTNLTTAGNYSVAFLSNIFVLPLSTSIIFSSSITSQEGELVEIIDNQVLNCTGAGRLGVFTQDINIYPNPSNGKMNLILNLDTEQDISYSVFNAIGQVVVYENGGTIRDFDTQFNLEEKGIYFLQLSIDNVITTKKLIVK